MQSIPTRGAMAAIIALAIAGPAWAGGFQVQQQGAKASGRAGAFTASADDASATYYNPAAVAQLEKFTLYLGGGTVRPDISFSGPSGSADMQDVAVTPAQFYFTAPLSENYALAVGAWVPYELRTHWWESDPMATSALKTSWTSRLYNFNVVARFNRTFSIAIGFEYIRFKVNDFSRAYDFGPLEATNPAVLFPPPEPLTAKLNQSFTGEKAGANLALHYASEDSGWRFGVSMRTKKIVHMDGQFQWNNVSEATFTRVGDDPDEDGRFSDLNGNDERDPDEPWFVTLGDAASLLGLGDRDCPAEPEFCAMGNAFKDSPAEMTVVIPATIQLGIGQDGRNNWDWEVDILWTQWSTWDSVDTEVMIPNGVFDTQLNLIATTWDTNMIEDWSDTWTLSVGFDYHINDAHAVRGGVIYDPSPVKNDHLKPYNPDSDRMGLTAGYGYRSGNGLLAFDIYGQYYMYDDAVAPADGGRFVVEGTYQTSAMALGASLQFSF